MAERFALPPLITGTTWANVHAALWSRSPRGVAADDEGTIAPRWTCREAMAVIEAARQAAKTGSAFPLWYQFAAVAYGWDPTVDSARLDNSQEQADRDYDADAAVALQLELQRITSDLDESGGKLTPELRLDGKAFDRPGVQSEVRAALRADGISPTFKVPLPACKDPRTGKPGIPRRNPKTGKWECEVVTIDDPVTAIGKSAGRWILPALLLYAAWKSTRHDRRRK